MVRGEYREKRRGIRMRTRIKGVRRWKVSGMHLDNLVLSQRCAEPTVTGSNGQKYISRVRSAMLCTYHVS